MEKILGHPLFYVFAWLTLTSVVGTIAHYWYKMRRDELEASLKHEMIRRGMSADEITKVLKASKSRAANDLPAEEPSSPEDAVDYKN